MAGRVSSWDEISSHLHVNTLCDISEPNLKNVCGKKHATNAWKKKATKNYVETT